MKKFLIIISVVFLSVFAFFFSNIKGYYRFKQYCEAESGLRVYEQLERDVGWLAESRALAGDAAMLNGVTFGRYVDFKKNITYDVKYVGGDVRNDSSYQYVEASSTETVYELTKKVVYLDDKNRLKKISNFVSDRFGRKVLIFNAFYYSAWGGSLGGPDWVSCSSDSGVPGWKSSVEKSFKN